MRTSSAIFLICAAVLTPTSDAPAQSADPAPNPPFRAEAAKKAKRTVKSANAGPAPQAVSAPSCARGKWKDDPVCFGENDPSALPTPSGVSGASHAGDVSLTPKADLNTTPRTQQDPISFTGNNPDPKPSSNTFGGGIGVNFPF